MSLNFPARPQSNFRSLEGIVPYDNIYVFHDAENCYLPSKIEARDSNNHLIYLPNNGGVKFFENVPGVGAIQGAYVYKEVIRTAIACKIGREQAKNINIVALDTNIYYHFVISPRALNTPFYPAESTIKDFVDIGGGNFYRHVPSDIKSNPSWADQKIKEIWDSQAEQCKKSFSREAIKRTLFILISGDRDFAPQIRNAVKTGLDVSIIFSMDSPIRPSMFEILESHNWATGNWLDIVRESRKRSQVLPYFSSGTTKTGQESSVSSPARPPSPKFLIPTAPISAGPVVSADKRSVAYLLYDFIVQWAAEREYPESRMRAVDTHFFFKNHPEVEHKVMDFCNAYPDLFYRYSYGNADWIRCIEKKKGFDCNAGLADANLMYDFIVQWASKKGYPENRMLGTHIQYFFKEHPEVKAKMGAVKISEFCGAYPTLFYRHNDGKADWIHCIARKDTVTIPDRPEKDSHQAGYHRAEYAPAPRPFVSTEKIAGREEANLLYDFIVHFAAEKAFPESRMLASDTHRFFKSHPEVKHKLADYCNAYPDLFSRYKYEGADWVRCVEEKHVSDNQYAPRPVVSVDCTAGRPEANILYDFIVQWAIKKAFPESRMLTASIELFFKEHPEVKAKMGAVKISEFLSSYPDMFYRRNDGKADWIHCITNQVAVSIPELSDKEFSDPHPGYYIAEYVPGEYAFDTLDAAKAACRSNPLCNGITLEPSRGHRFTLRQGKTLIPSTTGGTSWLYQRATTALPPPPPHTTQRFSFQVKRFVASFGMNFLSQTIKVNVDAINPGIKVEFASASGDEEKWFANIFPDEQVGRVASPVEFQHAEDTVRRLLDTITIDEPIELLGIQPELLRDNSGVRDLALREEVIYHITNLGKVPNATVLGFKASSAKFDYPDRSHHSTIMPEFFGENIADIKKFIQCAETICDYIRYTGSHLQPIHMAAYYDQYPEMKAILKNPNFELKDFCRAFPHLLHMKVDNDKKEWIVASKYSDDAVHLYSFILEEGEMVNGSRRIMASKLGTFYKRYPQDENTIKQGKRKPKMFVQQHEDLFKWVDATVEVGFGYIYCVYIDPHSSIPSRSSVSIEAGYKRSSNPTYPAPNSSSTISAMVVLVYISTNVTGKERVRQFMQSLCRITEQFILEDRVYIQMCKTAWPILSATALDVKVGYSSSRDSFSISATGTPDAAKSYIDFMKDRVGTIESCLLKIPASKQGLVGLLYGLRQKSNELLAGECNAVAAGYTSCYYDVVFPKTFKSVVISFLPPWDSNVDINDERQLFDSLVATMKDVIDTYDEAVCHSRMFRRGINISEVKGKFSLYHANFNKISGNFFFCGDSQSVKAAYEWLTVVPTAEKEVSQIFKVSDGRLVYILRNNRHAKVLDELKRAVIEGGSRSVVITELVYFSALFGVKGPSAFVEAAITEGQAFVSRLVATFLDRLLLGPNQSELTESQFNFFKTNEGSYLIKKMSNEFGISLKYVSGNNFSEEDSQNLGATSIIELLLAKIGSVEIRVAQGDMLRVECDTIINPANSRLAHGAGVARAISDAAGPELNAQCEDILKRFDGELPMSEAVVTDSYDLKRFNQHSKIVVHSVGPTYSTESSTEIEMECYQQTIINALDKAVENGATYIAMPLIGSGVFGWPVEVGAREMLGAISKWVGAGNSCKRVILIDLEEDKAAAMVQTVQLFNEKVAPLLISNSKKAATATATTTAMKVPQFSWYWEVYSHEMDPLGNLLFNQPDTIVTAGGAHWVPYNYDQVLQIEAGLADDSFPVILNGVGGDMAIDSSYLIHRVTKPLIENFELAQSVTQYHQETTNSESTSTRPVLQGEPFDPITGSMQGYNKGAVLAVRDSPVLEPGDAAADRFPLVEDIQVASEIIKKEGLEIFGPKDLVLSAESAIHAALFKEEHGCARSFDLQISAPEDWDSVLQRLRTLLLVQQTNVAVVDASSPTAPRTVIVQAMGSQALAQAEKEVLNFVFLISLERSKDLSVKWPEEWTGGPLSVNADNSSTTLFPVDRDSDEWQRVEAEWRKVGHPSRAISAELLKVERVQNVKAWEAYYSRVRLLAGRNKESLPSDTSIFQRANEQWMKHGTDKQGMDCRSSHQGFFGNAVYTAEDALYADTYCFNLDDGTRQMFLVRVAAGNVHEVVTRSETHQSLVYPPSGFDSVRGCVLEPNFMAIMVYQPESAYPAYFLTYKTT